MVRKRRGKDRTGGLRAVPAVVLAVLVVAAIPVAAAAPAATGTGVQTSSSCPPSGVAKTGDVNGDGVDDWKFHEQVHPNGTLELWCVDGDPPYYAVVWVDDSGDRHFVGKCPFGEGRNDGSKLIDGNGNLVRVTWVSVDAGDDDDGDGKTDDAIYRYYPANNTVVVMHSENGAILDNRSQTPEEPPFDFGDLPPEDPTDDDFWAAADRPRSEVVSPMVLSTGPRDLTVAVRDSTTGEPLGGTTVEVGTRDGSPVETLVTSEAGTAATELDPGEYVLDVEGAGPRLLDLTHFSMSVTVAANATAGDRVARLEERIDRLQRENEALGDRVERLERDNERLRENVTALQTEVADLRSRPSGITIPGFGLLLAAVALVAAAALARRSRPGRRPR